MADDALKRGDVVRLKSGGPEMTVKNIAAYGMSVEEEALCTWFEGKTLQEERFALETLEKVQRGKLNVAFA